MTRVHRPTRPTRPTRPPAARVHHENWRRAYRVNSPQGTHDALAGRCRSIDNDNHATRPEPGGIPEWLNSHGTPETFWMRRGDRFEHHTWAELSKMHRKVGGRVYSLRTGAQELHDHAAHGLDSEFEVKGIHPYGFYLHAMFAQLALDAHTAYGDHWHDHVIVKVLTDLGGGEAYALAVCRAASAAGFRTMLLARGVCRFRRYIGHTEVTYVRGSAVIR